MAWWDDKAERWQRRTQQAEDAIDFEYPESSVRRATVHGRQDIVMIVSHLSALNRQIAHAKILMAIITVLLAYIAYRLSIQK